MSERPLVIALGGNAVKTRPGTMEIDGLEPVCETLAGLAGDGLVITHGSGPQIGLLADGGPDQRHTTLDVLDAEVEGWLGYLIEQELDNWLESGHCVATLLTRIEVDANDAAFSQPSKPVGGWISEAEARQLVASRGWEFLVENGRCRRLVPSPYPRRVLQLRVIADLLREGHTVICAGGGGIPVVRSQEGKLQGVDAVVDKDLASALLASQLQARLLVLATDVSGVYRNWADGNRHLIDSISCRDLAGLQLPPGSMGPKAAAAVDFVKTTGNNAVIGSLDDLSLLVEQRAGTLVVPD